MLKILKTSAYTSIQDLGRTEYRSYAVSLGGAVDRFALHCANLLVGNLPDTPAIEIALGPVAIQFKRDCWISLMGADFNATLDHKKIFHGWRHPVKSEQILRLSHAQTGVFTYLAIDGGIEIQTILGGKGTDLNNKFGGFNGRNLQNGDELKLGKPNFLSKCIGILQPSRSNRIRIITGPEFNNLTPLSQEDFWSQNWNVTSESNRMGYRLSGNILRFSTHQEMLSHVVFPGLIQLPPNGQPIVLLADAQTTGGYPRIGWIIAADMWQFVQTQFSKTIQFSPCSLAEAIQALKKQEEYKNKIQWGLNYIQRELNEN
ncbi:5-oxoprolinase subunit C family protein [Fluviispira vulneris]|uniref:5-oxoprolinase subunit C family protein n=1 Tax=Fluviispira vulneris TaxID=2763012 RepID=UPI0016452685|nr:biotin-dependent carboxyltransferase family protein [Fluviispira vulneris]